MGDFVVLHELRELGALLGAVVHHHGVFHVGEALENEQYEQEIRGYYFAHNGNNRAFMLTKSAMVAGTYRNFTAQGSC